MHYVLMREITRAMRARWRWMRQTFVQSLTFDPSPDRAIVRYRLVAPETADDASATVFGDGRVEVQRRSAGADGRLEGLLTQAELQTLLAALLESGLPHFDPARLARERARNRDLCASRIDASSRAVDLGRSEIQLHLVSGNDGQLSPLVIDAVLCAVQDEAAAFPQWNTIVRYAVAERRLRGLLDHPSLTLVDREKVSSLPARFRY
jgi:hypothetical protein